MLAALSIKNYALIEELNVKFDKGFSNITGETGAGKSILLGALGLVLGKRADVTFLKNKEQKCIIEVEFSIKDYQLQSKFKAWLYVFVYNICINYVKRDKHHNQLKSKAPVYELESIQIEEVSDSSVFELRVEALDKLLMQISPEEKTILLLKYQDELTVNELSKLYGVGESAIKMRIKRAKEKLVKLKNLNE